MVEAAFIDACQTYHGEPTLDAQEAYEWIMADTDWTKKRGTPIPPSELREGFFGSFDWACRWLSFDPALIRQHGLPRQTCRVSKTGHAQKTRPRVANVKHSIGHIAGLPEVHATWKRAREAWQSSHPVQPITESVTTAALESRAITSSAVYH